MTIALNNIPSINLTDSAVNRFKELLENSEVNHVITLTVTGTGCNGFSYKLDIQNKDSLSEDFLQIYSYGNTGFYVDGGITQLVEDLTIDYVRDGFNQHFKFTNPKETARCGCGNSFTV